MRRERGSIQKSEISPKRPYSQASRVSFGADSTTSADQFRYDVIPYVTTAVFPESHLGVIQISGILTAPQSLSYRKSARPGKC